MNELALFAGAGGGLLATQELGVHPICAVELDEHCRCVLVQRQNERHLRTPFPVWDDIRTFNGRTWRGRVGIVTGGFPCQAFSTAARGNNTAVDLWPEMRRVVEEVESRYVFAENVSKKAIDRACDDLEAMGYTTCATSLSAADLGADHVRERFWLLAYADDKGELRRTINAEMARLPEFCHGVWDAFPGESRMADGVAGRVERHRATGNGQVSIVAAAALWVLANA